MTRVKRTWLIEIEINNIRFGKRTQVWGKTSSTLIYNLYVHNIIFYTSHYYFLPQTLALKVKSDGYMLLPWLWGTVGWIAMSSFWPLILYWSLMRRNQELFKSCWRSTVQYDPYLVIYKQIPGAMLFNIIRACMGCFRYLCLLWTDNCENKLYYFSFVFLVIFVSPSQLHSKAQSTHAVHMPRQTLTFKYHSLSFSSTLKVVSHVLFLN